MPKPPSKSTEVVAKRENDRRPNAKKQYHRAKPHQQWIIRWPVMYRLTCNRVQPPMFV